MANSKRREEYTDRNGNMFIPMNVEGGIWNEHFITTPKFICIVGIVISLFVILLKLSSNQYATFLSYVVWLGIWGIVSSLILRFIVFEEKAYYRMYKELKVNEITSPALFWNIASIKNTDDGAILTYSDARVAIMVRIERDTITGKNEDFKEIHYDAISDFYKEVATKKYSFVQMNIMEHAGKDPRLAELSKLVTRSDNDNICKLMELMVGHIKNITQQSLYESDYFLFYTQDTSKMDYIIQDISECLFKLLDGAYIGFNVLTNREIVDLVKELNGVNYFNSTEASLSMFSNESMPSIKPIDIVGLVWDNGEEQEFNFSEKNRLKHITSSIINETENITEVSLKNTLYRKENKNEIGIDFNELSNIPLQNNGNTDSKQKTSKGKRNSKLNHKPKQEMVNQVNNEKYSQKYQENSSKLDTEENTGADDTEYIDF